MQRSIKIFFWLFVFTSLSVPSLSASRQFHSYTNHCETFLVPQNGFTPEAFSHSSNGALIYEHFQLIVGNHSSSLVDIVNSPENRHWTVSDILNFIAEDRQRIRAGLIQLTSEFQMNDDHRKMVEYVLRQLQLTAKDQKFLKQLEHYHKTFGFLPAQGVNADSAPLLMPFLYAQWAINRSYVSELQTAFEIKGVYALSAKVWELLPQDRLSEFVEAFRRLGKDQILQLEIDVASRDPISGQQVWVEVKNVNNRIMSQFDSDIKGYRKKKSALREFNDIINRNPRLKYFFPDSVEFVWLIRGAGVERHVREAMAVRGLYLFDRRADGINAMIDQRTSRFRAGRTKDAARQITYKDRKKKHYLKGPKRAKNTGSSKK